MPRFGDSPPPVGDVIPHNTMVRAVLTIRPGGDNRPGEDDGNVLKRAKAGDVRYLDCEFTVVGGPHDRRKFWDNIMISGGATNDQGESKAGSRGMSTILGIINSAKGLSPSDNSAAANAAREMEFTELDGLEFACKLQVESQEGYQDKNRLGTIIQPGHKDYDAIMAGEAPVIIPATVTPAPRPGFQRPAGPSGPPARQWGKRA